MKISLICAICVLTLLATPVHAETAAVSEKMRTALSSFEDIATRLGSRMEKLRNVRMDIAAAEQRLAETKVAITKAQRSYATLTPADSPEAAALLRLELHDLYTELELVHKGLGDVVALLKVAPVAIR